MSLFLSCLCFVMSLFLSCLCFVMYVFCHVIVLSCLCICHVFVLSSLCSVMSLFLSCLCFVMTLFCHFFVLSCLELFFTNMCTREALRFPTQKPCSKKLDQPIYTHRLRRRSTVYVCRDLCRDFVGYLSSPAVFSCTLDCVHEQFYCRCFNTWYKNEDLKNRHFNFSSC